MQARGRYRWNEDAVIGSSEHAKVVLGYENAHSKIAVKIVDHEEMPLAQKKALQQEMRNLKLLQNHPNIIKLKDAFIHNNQTVMVMEFIEMDLLAYLEKKRGKISKSEITHIFKQILAAVKFMHKQYIIHGDIKLENIMYDSVHQQVRIIDFGHSEQIDSTITCLKGMTGTNGYIAPELFVEAKRGHDPYKSDIYSLGVVLFTMLFNQMPFDDNDGETYYASHKTEGERGDVVFPRGKVSPKITTLLCSMLSFKPEDRPSLEAIEQQLRHLKGFSFWSSLLRAL